jgi:hypothetical protein
LCNKSTLEKTEGAIKNEWKINPETCGNTGHSRQMQTKQKPNTEK